MRLVLVGPPGSGKGTQSNLLSHNVGLRHIGTGSILREEIHKDSEIGRVAAGYIHDGKFVPDEVVNQLVARLFHGEHPPAQFVIDGYPRTVAQAEFLTDLLAEVGLELDAVVLLVVPEDEAVGRLRERWECLGCGETYHIKSRRPKVWGVCDTCGEKLSQRVDDHEDQAIRMRLDLFHANIEGILSYYRERGLLREVIASGSIESVHEKIIALAPKPSPL